jgi:hypothetical protein
VRRRLLAVLAVLTLTSLVTFDCLNLLHSDSWSDLTQAPHLAAVNAIKAGTKESPGTTSARSSSAVVPAALLLLVVWLGLGWADGLVTTTARRPRLRRRGRAPPAALASRPARL